MKIADNARHKLHGTCNHACICVTSTERNGQDDEKLAYRRLKLLGQGSFGKAFLARDLSNHDLVVMKQAIGPWLFSV